VKGHAVTVLEREKQLGGLATYHDYGPFFWDRFYHCIVPSDTHLIGFLTTSGSETSCIGAERSRASMWTSSSIR